MKRTDSVLLSTAEVRRPGSTITATQQNFQSQARTASRSIPKLAATNFTEAFFLFARAILRLDAVIRFAATVLRLFSERLRGQSEWSDSLTRESISSGCGPGGEPAASPSTYPGVPPFRTCKSVGSISSFRSEPVTWVRIDWQVSKVIASRLQRLVIPPQGRSE